MPYCRLVCERSVSFSLSVSVTVILVSVLDDSTGIGLQQVSSVGITFSAFSVTYSSSVIAYSIYDDSLSRSVNPVVFSTGYVTDGVRPRVSISRQGHGETSVVIRGSYHCIAGAVTTCPLTALGLSDTFTGHGTGVIGTVGISFILFIADISSFLSASIGSEPLRFG